MEGFSHTQISTLAVKDNLLVAGGFQGELTCKVRDFDFFSVTTKAFSGVHLYALIQLF